MADLWEDKFAENFLAQPAQLTATERDQIEMKADGNHDRKLRRLALHSLSRSGSELIEAAVSVSRETAVDVACLCGDIESYAGRLRSLADMMTSASTRLSISLCARQDMQAIIEEAKALHAGGEVGHG